MLEAQEDVFYYVTVMNENYAQPRDAATARRTASCAACIVVSARRAATRAQERRSVQLLGSGTILREVLAAAEMLENEFGVAADVWSVTSYTELRRDGMDVERWNTLHPTRPQRTSYVEQCLSTRRGPGHRGERLRARAARPRSAPGCRAATSRSAPTAIGRSDTREALRRFFEVDRKAIVISALKALADEERIAPATVGEAMERYGISDGTANPWDA